MGIFRECPIVTSYILRTHEPCVPTGQVNFPHGSLLPTTYYLLLTTSFPSANSSTKNFYYFYITNAPLRNSLHKTISIRMVSANCFPLTSSDSDLWFCGVRNIKLSSIRRKHHPAVISYFCLLLGNGNCPVNIGNSLFDG